MNIKVNVKKVHIRMELWSQNAYSTNFSDDANDWQQMCCDDTISACLTEAKIVNFRLRCGKCLNCADTISVTKFQRFKYFLAELDNRLKHVLTI